MLNLTLRAQVPRKAGAKLQHFHEMSKSFAKFYIAITIFLRNLTDYQTDSGAQASLSHSFSSALR